MYDYLIIGAGIIGLNIAKNLKERFPNNKIIVLEKEDEVGFHSSGRNSGVLHAGFYYTANSLKAKFTKEGNALMKEFVKERGLHLNECKKVVVTQNEDELKGLEELKRRGDVNGVELHWLNESELEEAYPNIKTFEKALLCPSTATVNPKEVTLEFAKVIKEMGVEIVLSCKYIKSKDNIITTNKGEYSAKKIINCAGLYADNIARDFGFSKDYVIIPFKGIYLKDKNNKANLETNIYPVPNLDNPFLGVHYTLTVDGESKIGPTAIPAFWRENYKGFDNFSLKEFTQILYYEAKLFITNAFGFRSRLCEALSLGACILTSKFDQVSIPFLKDNYNCYIVDDLKKTGSRIIEIIKNKKNNEIIKKNARSSFLNHLSYDSAGKKYEELISSNYHG